MIFVILLHSWLQLPNWVEDYEMLYPIFGFMIVVLLLEASRVGIFCAIVYYVKVHVGA